MGVSGSSRCVRGKRVDAGIHIQRFCTIRAPAEMPQFSPGCEQVRLLQAIPGVALHSPIAAAIAIMA